MNSNIKETCDLIIGNRAAIKRSMMWEIDSNSYAIMSALITAGKGVSVDPVKYKECKKIIRKNINVFSEIRGIGMAMVATKMTLSDNPEEYIQGVNTIYKKLRSLHKLSASPYMVMAAVNIYEHSGVNGADADIEKLEKLYKDLKKQHPLLIWDEDRGYLSMLVTSGLNIERTVEDIEASYEASKKISISKDAVHSLAQVLALSEMGVQAKTDLVKGIIAGLKKNKKHISKTFGLTAVGALSLLDIPAEQLVDEITEVDEYFKLNKGFKWYYQSPRIRLAYSTLAVFMAYSKEKGDVVSSEISSNIAMNIAEEIIMMIIIMISVQQSAARSSSSN